MIKDFTKNNTANKEGVIRFLSSFWGERDEDKRKKNCMIANIEKALLCFPPSSSVKHYKFSNFMRGCNDRGRILDCYPNRWWLQFDFLNFSNKIKPHHRTNNSKEILEHCRRRFVTIKISLYVRRRKNEYKNQDPSPFVIRSKPLFSLHASKRKGSRLWSITEMQLSKLSHTVSTKANKTWCPAPTC